ncbi:MAG: bifunctional phosphopantothenoylcysteine decarboxylase/phosphopantothenate--cysteine ligase CoaBC [Dehalococcoidia bacterium]|nr:bifunctional phosphopantothenoylcysteine decarboxylase/phosphopantothenate--cysteine ligase CoaBC [Dehalococcoidia bacterium]MDW8009898.1 bifunctional phosphopantothenoylcysteine decarboxylase/phosphopantothenate--cysteine ligase CoaBC [Chloroflexota bacterium]
MYNLTGRRIVLGVAGSIAAYKAVDLASQLTQLGAQVDAVLTEEATRFVTALSFASVTGRPAYSDMFAPSETRPELHVQLGREAELVLVAPATATTLARLALGLADDLLSLTALCTRAPLVLCPAMDSHMWEHPATRENVSRLRERGALVVGPEVGRLASGQVGPGRLAERETVLGAVRYVLGQRYGDLRGRRIVVTAGGTQEPIDPVRYVSNRSSGKMGYAVAEAARDRGAQVTLVTAPTSLPDPYGVETVHVRTACEMRDAVLKACRDADALVMAAAVADFRPAQAAERKLKRGGRDSLVLEMVPTPDILGELRGAEGLVRVGFAAETDDLLTNAQKKLQDKALDLLVANDVTAPGAGFGTDTNKVVIMHRSGQREDMPLMSKYDVAWHILDRVAGLLEGRKT